MWLKARRIINGLPYTSLCVRPSLGRIGRISGDARLKALSIMAVVNEFLLYMRICGTRACSFLPVSARLQITVYHVHRCVILAATPLQQLAPVNLLHRSILSSTETSNVRT